MKRLARPCLLLICIAALLALSPTVALAESAAFDLRPASAVESAGISAALSVKFPGNWANLTNGRTSDHLGLAAVDVEIDYSASVALFELYPDGTASYLHKIPESPLCLETRDVEIPDVIAESLQIVSADACSHGKPQYLTRAQVRSITTLKNRVNRNLTRFKRKINDCETSRCLYRARNRYMRGPLAKLISRTSHFYQAVSWSYCRDHLWNYKNDVTAWRGNLDDLLFWASLGDSSGVNKSVREMNKIVKKTKVDHNGIKAECIYYSRN